MPFKKGDPKPPGSGAKPGQVYKKDLLVRHVLDKHGIDLIDQILIRLKELDKKDQVEALIKLMPYVYPRLTNIEVSGNIGVGDRLLEEAKNEDLDAILAEARKV